MSGLYKIGKIKVLQILEKHDVLRNDVSIFYNPKAAKDDIIKCGERFLVSLYGDTSKITLDELRFKKYNAITARQNISTNFNLAALPPTSDAAKYHISRIYFQIQEWLDYSSDPLEWGWKDANNELHPITMEQEVAPEFILKMIFCNCKTGCIKQCSCKKSSVFCSNLCGSCQGNSCENMPDIDSPYSNDTESDEEI